LKANVEFSLKGGVHGLMILGSTGEFPLLKVEERVKVVHLVRAISGATPVLVNISDLRPDIMLELARTAKDADAAAVSLLPPSFFAVAQEDLAEFFVRGGEAAERPLFLYNFPERTGNRISLETVRNVAGRVPLAGVKQSGAEFEYHSSLVALGRELGFVVFTGADTRLPEAMQLGVTGCVSGLANVVPELVVEIFAAMKAGNPEASSAAISRMRDLEGRLGALAFPLNVAAAMEARGRWIGAPKTIISPATRARYETLKAQLRALFLDWGLP
jgi:4-hydroxy-tetrahydrodipicolinate synthase